MAIDDGFIMAISKRGEEGRRKPVSQPEVRTREYVAGAGVFICQWIIYVEVGLELLMLLLLLPLDDEDPSRSISALAEVRDIP